jgi:hypothetical protein
VGIFRDSDGTSDAIAFEVARHQKLVGFALHSKSIIRWNTNG